MAQKPHGIRRWQTNLHYNVFVILFFIAISTAYSCTDKKVEGAMIAEQKQEPNFSLIGKKLEELYDSKYSSSGMDFLVSKNLAKQTNSKSDVFVDLGGQLLEGTDVRIITLRTADSKKASGVDNKQNRYLFVEKKGAKGFVISDTLNVKKGQDYSVNTFFENGRKGIAVGNFNEAEEFFEITALYEISNEGKKKKLDLNTTVLDCPVPLDYIREDDSGNYQFGVKNQSAHSRFWKENSSETPAQNGFYVLDEATISLKDKTLKVTVLEKNAKKVENAQHFDLRIEVSEKSGKGFAPKSNTAIVQSLDGSCSADGFTDVVSKDNYFTIEQTFCKDALYVSSYTTFKVVGNDILLHKYSESYTDRNNPDKEIKDKIWTNKDFGQIKFENFNYKTSIKR